MKVRRGWLLSLNTDTQKMTPFFVKVRSSDIVMTDAIDITAALKHTSTRWKLARKEDRVDCTFYHYTASWSDTYDANAEVVGSKLMDGELDYYLYKDGRLEIDGYIRANGTYTAIDANWASVTTSVYLPYAFEEVPKIRACYEYGGGCNVNSVGVVSGAVIGNQQLNLNGKDTKKYNYLMKLTSIVPVNNTVTTSVPLVKIQALAETNATYKAADYKTYISSYLPIHVSYKGYWRSAKSVNVIKPTSKDDALSGTYATKAPVNMYAGPNTTSDRIRSLAAKTNVQCSGYYSETDGTKYLYVLYSPTAQYGYISEDYLIKK